MAEVWDLGRPAPRKVEFEDEEEIDRMRLRITDAGLVVVTREVSDTDIGDSHPYEPACASQTQVG